MSPAQHEPEGGGLTVLTVREGEASIRDFRFDCRGETSCRAELGELLQLLERRHADVAIFLAHPNLVGSLIEELRRHGREIPEMVIAPPAAGAEPRVTVSVSLSGLSESAHPQEILARLYEALRAAQRSTAAAESDGLEGLPQARAAGSAAEASPQRAAGSASDQAAISRSEGGRGAAGDEASDGAQAVPGNENVGPSAEVEELSARLERILNQRLQRSQP